MIAVIEYGMGNTASILNMIRRLRGNAVISSDHNLILAADALILPGIGAFDNAIQRLHNYGLYSLIRNRVLHDKIPFLGICLGMQLLFDSSEEGTLPGLCLINGKVKKFDFSNYEQGNLKIPHMGWNTILLKNECELFEGFSSDPRFYFVHSYHVICEKPKNIIATCNYGYDFACSVQNENVFAVQFHPEKSHRFGLKLFQNFIKIIC